MPKRDVVDTMFTVLLKCLSLAIVSIAAYGLAMVLPF